MPFRTLAADLGAYRTSEPKFRGKGGLVAGQDPRLHQGVRRREAPAPGVVYDEPAVMDGAVGIFGAHFDVFAGTKTMAKRVKLPSAAHVWFPGIERRIGPSYTYGLYDK